MPAMIAFYISAHGYGHAGRSLEVIAELEKLHPVTIVSEVPEHFFRPRSSAAYRRQAFDCGLIQKDSVRGDVPATLGKIQEIIRQAPVLLQQEQRFLEQQGVRLVIVDSPSLPLQAARTAGIPGVTLTSFGWDYIYQLFASQDSAWDEVCAWFRQGYAQASHSFHYPFSAPLNEHSLEVPLVARAGRSLREEIARESGADPAKPWAVVWFHDLDLDPRLLEQLPYELFTKMDWPKARRCSAEFGDLVASADVVITKPGFGIVSDCIANRKPLVYVPRDDFSEAYLLEDAIHRYCAYARIEAADLYRGNWLESLEKARRARPAQPPPPQNGAASIARRLAGIIP